MKGWIPCNLQGALTVTIHNNIHMASHCWCIQYLRHFYPLCFIARTHTWGLFVINRKWVEIGLQSWMALRSLFWESQILMSFLSRWICIPKFLFAGPKSFILNSLANCSFNSWTQSLLGSIINMSSTYNTKMMKSSSSNLTKIWSTCKPSFLFLVLQSLLVRAYMFPLQVIHMKKHNLSIKLLKMQI